MPASEVIMKAEIEVTDRDPLESALKLHEFGWPVFPVHSVLDGRCSCGNPGCEHPAKHPLTRHGFKEATTNVDQIQHFWSRWPSANIAVVTGKQSGLVILDVDPRDGGDETLKDLQQRYYELPETVAVITGSGGRHLYFQHPGWRVGSSAGALGDGLDIRGDGGYVVAPRSRHISGRCYEFEVTCHPEDVEIAPCPNWLLELLKRHQTEQRIRGLSWEEVIRGVNKSRRNSSATQVMGKLLAHFPTNDWDDLAWPLIQAWNLRNKPPLSEKELRRVFESIAKMELGKRAQIAANTEDRWTRILHEFAKEVGLSEVARRTEIPKQTLSRMHRKRLTVKDKTAHTPLTTPPIW